jgi:hypothetical protein
MFYFYLSTTDNIGHLHVSNCWPFHLFSFVNWWTVSLPHSSVGTCIGLCSVIWWNTGSGSFYKDERVIELTAVLLAESEAVQRRGVHRLLLQLPPKWGCPGLSDEKWVVIAPRRDLKGIQLLRGELMTVETEAQFSKNPGWGWWD